MMRRASLILILSFAVLLCAAMPSGAQAIRAEISSTEAELGEVLEVQVTLVNPSQASAPEPSETADFDIRLTSIKPVPGSRTMIVGNQIRQEISYTYRFTVRPLRKGNLMLPPFTYKEKGQTLSTKPIPVAVGQSTAGPFVICEIEVDSEVAYIGQPVNLRLKIYIRQYMQMGYGTLDASNTWSLRDARNCSWGVFSEVNLVPAVQQAQRPDDSGVKRDFYVYTMETTMYPSKSGPFEFGDIEFIYQYPVLLTRSLLGYQLERARRISAKPTPPTLTIKSIPTQGRPADYNGAVGVYSIFTTAKPTEVPVGDPITLTMSLRGAGSLDRLTPPRLEQVEALRRDFEISSNIPAGRIEGDRKIFNVTIRPLREDVKQIPEIPLSFFNPRTEQFETALSRPIPIKVLPAIRLALPGSAETGTGLAAGSLTPLVETTGGLLPNYTDPSQVLASQEGEIGAAVWVLLVALPLVYLTTLIVQVRSAKYRNNEALRRRSQAFANARRVLNGTAPPRPGPIRGAVLGYIADCCNVPAAGLTRAEAVRLARQRGLPLPLTERLDMFIEQLEYAEFGGGAGSSENNVTAALHLIGEMERCGFK